MGDPTPILAFIRLKRSFAAMDAGFRLSNPDAEINGRIEIHGTIMGANTIVAPVTESTVDVSRGWPSPDAVDYFELVGVSAVMASATPVEVVYEHDEDDEWYGWHPILEDRPSAWLERSLNIMGIVERPAFERRMLLVNYEQDLDEREMDRAKQRVRRRLGNLTPVWPGRSFEGYCFTDHQTPEAILESMRSTLDCDEIEDYLLAKPTHMIRPDKSGLSRLSDWMSSGWERQPRLNNRARRSGRFSRKG